MRKILLVEDNVISRDLLTRRLEGKGFQVVSAADGFQAIALAREDKPDLIVLDISLPMKDGWGVARELKESSDTQRIPIIALTGYGGVDDRERALRAGCTDFESKPISFRRLVAKIGNILGTTE